MDRRQVVAERRQLQTIAADVVEPAAEADANIQPEHGSSGNGRKRRRCQPQTIAVDVVNNALLALQIHITFTK